jgi:CRP-like cAMP-binding protein
MTPSTNEPEHSPSKEIDFTDIPLLADLDRIRLAELIPSLEQIHVKSGDILYGAGDPGDALFIIIDGIVRVFLRPGGQSLEIACLGPGDWFGELALLTGEPRTTDAEAQTDLTLLKLSRTTFDQLIKKYPSLGVSLAGLLAAKLASANVVMRGSGVMQARSGPSLPLADTQVTVSAPPVTAETRLGKRPRVVEGQAIFGTLHRAAPLRPIDVPVKHDGHVYEWFICLFFYAGPSAS